MPTSEEIRLLLTRLGDGGHDVAGVRVDRHDLERLEVPDSAAAREAERVAREACSTALLNHSIRSYAWGALLGIAENRRFDSEVFYVASLLHDIGLVPEFDRGNDFEVDGEIAARELLTSVGWDADRANLAAHAIRDHWDGPASEDEVESLLLAYGTSVDVGGWRVPELDPSLVATVVEAVPRDGFKREFIELVEAQARAKPHCHLTARLERGFADRVLAAPFAD